MKNMHGFLFVLSWIAPHFGSIRRDSKQFSLIYFAIFPEIFCIGETIVTNPKYKSNFIKQVFLKKIQKNFITISYILYN